MKTRIIFLLMLTSFIGFAQQDPHWSHYMFNKSYLNPGYVGVEPLSRGTFLHRTQWLNYKGIDPGGAPSTQMLSVSHPLKMFGSYFINSGVGGIITYDRLGPLKSLTVKGTFAYQFKLKNDGVLSTGLRLGIVSQGIDGSLLRAVDSDDAIVQELKAGGKANQIKPDADLGVWYNTRKYYAGISVSHITSSVFDYGNNVINSKQFRHLYLTGGYIIGLSQDITLTPSLLLQTDFAETTFNYGVIGDYMKYKFWGGFTFRQSISDKEVGQSGKRLRNDDIVVLVGLSLLKDKSLRIGYSFDLVTQGVSAKERTSHELYASYILPLGKSDKFVPLKTPRYRKVD